MDAVARSLILAQQKAEALFAEVVRSGLIQPGKLDSELSAEIHALAQSRFGVRRHWHRRIARSGPNTLLTYYDEAPDRRITQDDIVYLDFGPVFESWEADFGRTYALGADPTKQRLIQDIASAFQRGKELFDRTPSLTAGELYDFVFGLAGTYGWEFGASSAGHIIGHFPHETSPSHSGRLRILHGNDQWLREPDASGAPGRLDTRDSFHRSRPTDRRLFRAAADRQ